MAAILLLLQLVVVAGWMMVGHHATVTASTTAFVVTGGEAMMMARRRTAASSCRSRLYNAAKNNNNNSRKSEKEQQDEEEQARLSIYQARRQQIRQVLRAAESMRQFRLQKGYVPDVDPATGKPIKSDGQVAVAATAFVLAAGAIALRVGGRAALISAVGLDFLADSPELKDNLENILTTSESMDIGTKGLLFTLAWIAVKVLCLDAGGVVLALAAGILFGGVVPGAIASASAATLGSCVAYGIAQLDTPVRQRALQLLDDQPSLRGIGKVVARDGLKAVLTLRLAPVLPIPIGLYNYVYGVTNIPIEQFAGGIFLGSLKPYLLDSYLGYFGKEVIQGQQTDPLQDYLLVGALGVSVLIGVFASQLAAETWDSVLQEIEEEKKAKAAATTDADSEDDNDGIVRNVFGMDVPQWLVGFQLELREADARINDMIAQECDAAVWNFTSTTKQPIPVDRDPAQKVDSPEIVGAYQGIDLAAATCDGLVLSPLLFGAFLKYADPLLDPNDDDDIGDQELAGYNGEDSAIQRTKLVREQLLSRLDEAKSQTKERLAELDKRVRHEGN